MKYWENDIINPSHNQFINPCGAEFDLGNYKIVFAFAVIFLGLSNQIPLHGPTDSY